MVEDLMCYKQTGGSMAMKIGEVTLKKCFIRPIDLAF